MRFTPSLVVAGLLAALGTVAAAQTPGAAEAGAYRWAGFNTGAAGTRAAPAAQDATPGLRFGYRWAGTAGPAGDASGAAAGSVHNPAAGEAHGYRWATRSAAVVPDQPARQPTHAAFDAAAGY